jgi:UDP-glucose 4-epimerase
MTEILVVGGAGFLGSHLVPQLLETGSNVTVQDVIPRDQAAKLGDSINLIEYRSKNLGDITSRDVKGFDHVISVSAQADVPLATSSPRWTYAQNVESYIALLEAVRNSSQTVKLLLMSSENVYGAVPVEHLPITEVELPYPANSYGASKVAMESLAYAYSHQFGMPISIIRSTTMFGERSRLKQVIPIFIEKALKNDSITIEGSGQQSRDFTYVKNTVQGIMKALSWSGRWGLWNIGSGQEVTIKELAELIMLLTGSKSEIVFGPWRPGEEGLRFSVSIEKAKRELGYAPEISLGEGLERTISWFRSLKNK